MPTRHGGNFVKNGSTCDRRNAFIMEGDTPAFLGFTANGLDSFRSPFWGGWDGRYVYRTPRGETHPVWTQGGDMFVRTTSQDLVSGIDGKQHYSDHATIWRWCTAFQHDFAARMDWTIQPYAKANHNRVVLINAVAGTRPIMIESKVGEPLTLDAVGTSDPDGQPLRYRWFVYDEAGFSNGIGMADVELSQSDASKVTVTLKAACRAGWLPEKEEVCGKGGNALIILEGHRLR